MAEEKTLKPVSYRIDDETKEKFKEITASIGGNQQDTMATLINAYYMQQKEIGLSDYKADIDRFQAYITSLVTMYTNSLQTNHDMRDTIMSQFEETLKSKDSIIVDLQNQLAAAKQLKDETTSKAKTFEDECKKLTETVTALQSTVSDKDTLNRALTDSCNDLKIKVDHMTAAMQENSALKKDVAELNSANAKLISNVEKHERMLKEQQKHEADALEQLQQKCNLEKEKEILQLEKQYNDEIQKLKAEKQNEVDSYQKKYMELLEKLQNK